MEGLHQMLEAINTGVIGAGSTIDAGAFTKGENLSELVLV